MDGPTDTTDGDNREYGNLRMLLTEHDGRTLDGQLRGIAIAPTKSAVNTPWLFPAERVPRPGASGAVLTEHA